MQFLIDISNCAFFRGVNMRKLVIIKNVFYVIISFFYLLNIFAGLDLIPDNIPFIGNVDDGFFAVLLYKSIITIRDEIKNRP